MQLEAKREMEKELGDILAQVVEREAAIAALRENAGADGGLATPMHLAELEELRQKLVEHETMMVDINKELQVSVLLPALQQPRFGRKAQSSFSR